MSEPVQSFVEPADGGSAARLPSLRMSALIERPYELLAHLRDSAPVIAVYNHGFRMWLVTRHDDVRRVLADDGVVRDLKEHRTEINRSCVVRPGLSASIPSGTRRSFFDRD